VQASRLLPIEEALAQLGAAGDSKGGLPARSAAPAAKPAPSAPPPPPRVGPSPFELDRAKKAGTRPPEPQSSGANALAPEPAPEPMAASDPRQHLHAHLIGKELTHLADAVEHSRITISGSDMNVVTSKSYALYFKDRGLEAAVREVFGRALRIVVVHDEPAGNAGPSLAPPAAVQTDEATDRALANPEVKRFREVFGGEVRKVRNLKE
jgi:hypothetical protein